MVPEMIYSIQFYPYAPRIFTQDQLAKLFCPLLCLQALVIEVVIPLVDRETRRSVIHDNPRGQKPEVVWSRSRVGPCYALPLGGSVRDSRQGRPKILPALGDRS